MCHGRGGRASSPERAGVPARSNRAGYAKSAAAHKRCAPHARDEGTRLAACQNFPIGLQVRALVLGKAAGQADGSDDYTSARGHIVLMPSFDDEER